MSSSIELLDDAHVNLFFIFLETCSSIGLTIWEEIKMFLNMQTWIGEAVSPDTSLKARWPLCSCILKYRQNCSWCRSWEKQSIYPFHKQLTLNMIFPHTNGPLAVSRGAFTITSVLVVARICIAKDSNSLILPTVLTDSNTGGSNDGWGKKKTNYAEQPNNWMSVLFFSWKITGMIW